MTVSLSQIASFREHPVWAEIVARIDDELKGVDQAIERPDPFYHGKAVGERMAYRTILSYVAALEAEAKGESPYGNRHK